MLKNIANSASAEVNARTQSADKIKTQVAELQKIQADYLKQIQEGTVKPFEELRKGLSENNDKIAQATSGYQQYLALPEGSEERIAAGLKLQLLVNELRLFLQAADHPPGDNAVKLTAKQVAELTAINDGIKKARETPADPDQRMLLVGPNQRATFLFLPVPISIKTAEDTTVYFRSAAGGVFENGMQVIAKTADENGLVNTSWISRGNGVADCRVEIIGESILEDEWMVIKVAQPLPIELPAL